MMSRTAQVARPVAPAAGWHDVGPWRYLIRILPRGRRLSEPVWVQRHRWLVVLLWLHVPALFLFALVRGYPALRGFEVCAPLAVAGSVALVPSLGRGIRCASVALGLVGSASVLVYLSGGAIEAHFHYFVVIAFLTLYQEWMPYLIAIAFVLFEHGIVGVLAPKVVYSHPGMPGMSQHPWLWAAIHAGFVLAASVANLLAWRLTEHQALHDHLTGLPNRALFVEEVEAACDRRRDGSLAVLFIDLDNFKDANDAFGHNQGDQLLLNLTARLLTVSRDADVVGRLGGDEFGVILHDVEGYGAAGAAAERFLTVFKEPFSVNGLSIPTSASIGVVFSLGGSMTPAELMRNADLAMYDAKRAGGGRVSCFRPEMYDAVIGRAKSESELRGALGRNEFTVYYQPLVGIASGHIVGNEALVRWQHPTRGLVPPAEFVPMAEESGLIVDLGRWVLRSACAQTARWHREHPDRRPLTISVNLSPTQLASREILADVVDALRDSGLGAEYLCLEITESALINDFDSALLTLRAFKTMGVTLALDDFGTGYSSLSYLRRLPVDSLKIDRSFVSDLNVGVNYRIVVAIIEMAHALGMSVTAEGVETEEQFTTLRSMTTNIAQGYLLDRPMPPQELDLKLVAQASSVPWSRHGTT